MEFSFRVAFYLIVAVLIVMGSFFYKSKTRYFLVVLIVTFPFSIGIIFYRYHGIMLVDLPLIILVFMGLFTEKKFKLFFYPICLPVLLFFVFAFLGVFHAWPQGIVVSESMRIVRGYLIILCLINFVKTPKDVKAILYGILVVLAFQSLLGIYQWRIGSFGLRILGESGSISWRSKGTFQHPSYFGNYLAFLLPIVYRLFAFHKTKIKKEFYRYGFLFGATGIALFASYTRGPWIACGFVLIGMTLLSFRKKRLRPKIMTPIVIIAIFGCVFLVKYIPSVIAQFDPTGGRQYAAKIRMPLNIIALRVIKANPVVGVGLGNYKFWASDFVRDDETMVEKFQIKQLRTDMVHNTYLMIAAETGIPGLILFLWYLVVVFSFLYKCTKSIDKFLSNLSIGILAGYCALLLAFLVSPDFRIHQINSLIWITGGLSVAIYNLDQKYRKYVMLQRRKLLEVDKLLTS